jgi:hypothetical protein
MRYDFGSGPLAKLFEQMDELLLDLFKYKTIGMPGRNFGQDQEQQQRLVPSYRIPLLLGAHGIDCGVVVGHSSIHLGVVIHHIKLKFFPFLISPNFGEGYKPCSRQNL